MFDGQGVKLFRRDFASSYGWWGNIAVVLGRRPPEAEHVANYRACIVQLHREYPQGIGLITVVNDTSAPSPAGRDAIIAMFKDVWPLMTATLFVPNATGFKAAVLRSMMACAILVTGHRDRVHIESSLDKGLPWFGDKVLEGPDAQQRLMALRQGVRRFFEHEDKRDPDAR